MWFKKKIIIKGVGLLKKSDLVFFCVCIYIYIYIYIFVDTIIVIVISITQLFIEFFFVNN